MGADKEALSEEDEFAWLPPHAIRRRSRYRQLYTYIHTYIHTYTSPRRYRSARMAGGGRLAAPPRHKPPQPVSQTVYVRTYVRTYVHIAETL